MERMATMTEKFDYTDVDFIVTTKPKKLENEN
jgi:hypothetical protein